MSAGCELWLQLHRITKQATVISRRYSAHALLVQTTSKHRYSTMKATWNGTVIAQSDATVVVESNHYFPKDSIVSEHFADSAKTTYCPWKGDSSYFSVTVDGKTNPDAAWYYPNPKDGAIEIKGMVAFWRGVEVSEELSA